jgi:4-hydroxy-tetrahydrodipicolinate reductase
MTIKIGIAGITGRMGRHLAAEVGAAGATLVGGTGRPGSAGNGFADIADLAGACDVVVDFTHASTVAHHAAVLAEAGTGWVLGTTGFLRQDEDAVGRAAIAIPIVAAANFSPGVNMLLALAERLGGVLPPTGYDAEILEMHHRQKLDAPSGTALALGRAVAAGRGVKLEEVMVSDRTGHTAPRRDGEIGFATMRGGQIIGSHNVTFTAAFEQIGLTHHALDRRIFATGAIRAAFWVHGRSPGLYGMRDVLGL